MPFENETPEQDKIGREFDEDACDFCDRYKRTGLSKSSGILLNYIVKEGVQGKSVLDLGCGAGGFSVELLKQGAESAIGFDLSQNMIESARKLTMENGFADRAVFQVGNAATAEVPESDIVIMDKVLCCYSDWRPLLGNAMTRSNGMIGFIVPRDAGVAKIPFRIGVRVVNFFQKRKGKILFYLHPLEMIDRTLNESGFAVRHRKTARFWLVLLYSRSKDADRAKNQ